MKRPRRDRGRRLRGRLLGQRKVAGFTLIELVVVMAILGILAAFAMARFSSLEREARSAATQGLAGSLRSSASIAHGLWLATDAAPVTMEGNTIDMVNGYPDATDIGMALADATGFNIVVALGPPVVTTFEKIGAPGTCQVTYSDAPAAGAAPNINVDLSGC